MENEKIQSIVSLSNDDFKKFGEDILDKQVKINALVVDFITCVVAKSLEKYDLSSLKTINIDINHSPVNEGFEGSFMVWINGEDPTLNFLEKDMGFLKDKELNQDMSFVDLQEYIYETVKPHAGMLRDAVLIEGSVLRNAQKILSTVNLSNNLKFNTIQRKNNKI